MCQALCASQCPWAGWTRSTVAPATPQTHPYLCSCVSPVFQVLFVVVLAPPPLRLKNFLLGLHFILSPWVLCRSRETRWQEEPTRGLWHLLFPLLFSELPIWSLACFPGSVPGITLKTCLMERGLKEGRSQLGRGGSVWTMLTLYLSANPSPLTLVRCALCCAVRPLGVCRCANPSTTLLSCEHLLCVRCRAFGSLTTIMIANMCHVPLIDPSPQVLSVLLLSWLGWYLPIRVWERWPHLPSFHSVYFEVPTATCQSTNCAPFFMT